MSVNTIFQEEIYKVSIEDILQKFSVDPQNGLTESQVQESLVKYGKNIMKKIKKSFFRAIIAPIINLLIILYLISAFAMLLLGDIDQTIPIFVILGINVIIAVVQQFRAEKQLKSLKELSAAKSQVIRNGEILDLPSEKIVVGDIILFNQGDKIPADCRIIEAINLSMDESSLTGESDPVRKREYLEITNDKTLPLQDQRNMLFLGTFVASGRGKAVVTHIGRGTELGKISEKLEQSNTGDIPLRKKMNTIAIYLGVGVMILLIISIIYECVVLSNAGLLNLANFKAALANSINLGMKVMPINLPLLTTIVLLTGVLAIAQKGVIVRDLSRTESLGRVSVVCTDKTGTLTKNEMTAVYLWTPEMEYRIGGYGYEPKGSIYEINSNEPIVDNNIVLNKFIISSYLNNNALLKKEYIKPPPVGKKKSVEQEIWTISGLPTEGALLVLAEKYFSDIKQKTKEYSFIHEFSFSSALKRMSKIYINKLDNEYNVFSKGAPEIMLQFCSKYEINTGIFDLDNDIKNKILDQIKKYAGSGYRVLSICYRKLEQNNVPSDWEKDDIRESIEKNLIFLGIAVIEDPPREDVPNAVKDCKSAGIDVVMITGDNIATGKSIAKKLEIYDENKDLAVLGENIVGLSNEDFLRAKVYARVSPDHKEVVIKRYQELDKIVSMSGDGVNDALALSMADCGLAMGMQGTEVAKEAADMIITDDSFSTIVTGIREGRGLFMKIRSVIYFFICISVMEAIILFASSLTPNLNFQLFNYWQLTFLYASAHSFPSLGLTFDTNSAKIMDEKPRNSSEIISKQVLGLIFIQILLIGTSIVVAYLIGYFGIIPVSHFNTLFNNGSYYELTPSNHTVEIFAQQNLARTMSFAVLFILESIVLPMQIRRINEPIGASFKDTSYKKHFGWFIVSIIFLILIMYVVQIQEVFNYLHLTIFFMPLDGFDWLIVILLCIPPLVIFEWYRKRMRNKGVVY